MGVAVAHGASSWEWSHQSWGSCLELELADEAAWQRFLAVEAVQAALEAVPDPVAGLLRHPGRGGNSGSRQPAPPRPLTGSGSAALPLPQTDESLPPELPPEPVRVGVPD